MPLLVFYNLNMIFRYHLMRTLFVSLLILMMTALCYAQQSSEVEKIVGEVVKKYDGKQGVTCMTVAKGSGLELFKTMLKQEFGKTFIKGVTSITIIEYSDAPAETCKELHQDLDLFLSLLQEFDLSKEKDFSDNSFLRCFASESEAEEGTLSDFVAAIEDDKSKMLLYMAGQIKVD